jgi:hypothetical protein
MVPPGIGWIHPDGDPETSLRPVLAALVLAGLRSSPRAAQTTRVTTRAQAAQSRGRAAERRRPGLNRWYQRGDGGHARRGWRCHGGEPGVGGGDNGGAASGGVAATGGAVAVGGSRAGSGGANPSETGGSATGGIGSTGGGATGA